MDVRDQQAQARPSTTIFEPSVSVGVKRLTNLLKFLFPILTSLWIYQYLYDNDFSQTPDANGTSTPVIAHIDVSQILKQNLQLAKHSWEYGVLTHAVLELQNPELTVFSGPGIGVHLRSPPPGIKQLDAFPNGLLPKATGRRYDEWTRAKGLRLAAGLVFTNGSNSVWSGQHSTGDGQEEDARLGEGMMGTLIEGDGSPADAASLGWATLLLEAAGATDPRNPVKQGGKNVFGEAADRMVRCLTDNSGKCSVRYHVPGKNGAWGNQLVREEERDGGWKRKYKRWAISHRNDSEQLWGDSVFMVPPFLAAYAIARQDASWMREAIEQITVHRDELVRDVDINGSGKLCSGLWRHIGWHPKSYEENFTCCRDENVWLTSNAWALAGITRVLAAVTKWKPSANVKGLESFSDSYLQFSTEAREHLLGIIDPMLECMIQQQRDSDTGLVKNYLDGSEEVKDWSFGDTAGTAMVTSVIYRLAVLEPEKYATSSWLAWADENYNAVSKYVNKKDGSVRQVADISDVPSKKPVSKTSEGQSMVILMWTARRDCVRLGLCRQATRKKQWWQVSLSL